MSVRYDHKGKHFTEVQTKTPVPAIIQTVQQRIHGTIYLTPNHRLLDELEKPPLFLAVTDARVLSQGDEFQTAFLALQKSHIIWITPEVELSRGADATGH